ncbi:AAA family ATPase [Cryptosporangium sp. NPDC051539]|uniref:helix-turn-helix transcriptional regulator n=1 Tax=Cryptosporangium sp. NPDC051539 TaxID=3363962 RepID=UPI0037A4F3E5
MGRGDGRRARTTLVGRGAERTLIDETLAATRAGESRVLILRGDAGVGKSALLEYAVAAATGTRVMRAAGVESGMELAFAALHQLCAPLLDRRNRLPGPQRAALERVFGLREGAAPDRFLVGLAVLNLLSGASEEQPLLCVVDDAQWLDRASAQILGFVSRRLLAESIVLLIGVRQPGAELAGLPTLEVTGLRDADAHALLDSVTHSRLDQQIRDRIVAETKGNPLAMLELPRGLTVTQMAGGFGLLRSDPLPGRIEGSFLARIERLPAATRLLLLVAAAEPVGDPALVWRAARRLGVTPAEALAGGTDGLLSIGEYVVFRHPLVRSAVYGAAEAKDRRAAHLALAEATDAQADPDRRAWHLASAAAAPDEAVAVELEGSADRAQARGGLAAAAAFLQRSVALTGDASRRADRARAAAVASLRAGDLDGARRFADLAEESARTDFQRARVRLLRGQIAFASGLNDEGPDILLSAAQQLEPFDAVLARETYFLAWGMAALVAAAGESLLAISRAVTRLPPTVPGRNLDLALDGYALLVTEGRAAAIPTLLRVAAGLADYPAEDVLRWGWVVSGISAAVWDDELMHRLYLRSVEVIRDAGALTELPLCLISLGISTTWIGDFTEAAAIAAEADLVAAATGSPHAPNAKLFLAAQRGREAEASLLIDETLEQAGAGGQLMGVTCANWAAAILNNGLGRYDRAARAAQVCLGIPELWVSVWVLPELVEAAARLGEDDLARDALRRLTEATQPCGTDWALGILARSRAMLSEAPDTDALYLEAVERLGRTQLRPELARAHLVYGEWLRREGRRADARVQLGTAHDCFVEIGMEAFAERARRELLAAGKKVRARTTRSSAADELTPQERQIALLVRDGYSNPEVGERLFLSPRTVEWHLRKVFRKLSVGSRRELRDALRTESADDTAT